MKRKSSEVLAVCALFDMMYYPDDTLVPRGPRDAILKVSDVLLTAE